MHELGHVGAQPVSGTAFLPSLASGGRPRLVPESGCCRAPGVPLRGPEPQLPGSQGCPLPPFLPLPLPVYSFTKHYPRAARVPVPTPSISGDDTRESYPLGEAPRHRPGAASPRRKVGSQLSQSLPAWPWVQLPPSLSFLNLSVVQSLRHIRLCDPMNCSTPGLPVPHYLPEFARVHVH